MQYSEVANLIAKARSDWQEMTDISAIRASFEALFASDPPDPGETGMIAGLTTLTLGREGGFPVLYCHGGGFQIGSIRSHRRIMKEIALRSDRTVIGFDYPLSPEQRYPAAIDAALALYEQLVQSHDSIALAGDSAGANLVLALFQAARARSLPLPDRVVLISPWLDLTMSGESYVTKAHRDIFSTPGTLRAMARSYAGRGHDIADPMISPVNLRSFEGLPPTLIHAGDDDITLSDSLTFAQRAEHAGAPVRLRVWPGMFHHFQMFTELEESRESLIDIGAFLKSQPVPQPMPPDTPITSPVT